MKTAQQAAANWAASGGRASAAWSEGVNSYQGDWAAATTAQESVMLQNLNTAITNGSWRRGVQNTGTQGWKAATIASTANFQNGFAKGAANQAAAAQKIQNFLQSVVPNLPARGTFEQNKLRSTTLMDALHSQRGNLGAR